jgi:hypothetical protein
MMGRQKIRVAVVFVVAVVFHLSCLEPFEPDDDDDKQCQQSDDTVGH